MYLELFSRRGLIAPVLVLALAGCPEPCDDDTIPDDDDATGDDDDTTGIPDDDSAADDDTSAWMSGAASCSTADGYQLERYLAGPSAAMDGMDYAFEVTYTTVAESGDCGEVCDWTFPDGSYLLGHDPDYFETHGYPGYGAIFYAGSLWYLTIPDHEGHDVYFYYSYDVLGTFDQVGYWDFPG